MEEQRRHNTQTHDPRHDLRPFDGSAYAFCVWGYVVGFALLFTMPSIDVAQTRAKRATTNAEMRNVGMALHIYYDDHGNYPPGKVFSGEIADVKSLIPIYLGEPPHEISYASDRARLSGAGKSVPIIALLFALSATAFLIVKASRSAPFREVRARTVALGILAMPWIFLSARPDGLGILFFTSLPLIGGASGAALWASLRWGDDAQGITRRQNVIVGAVFPILLLYTISITWSSAAITDHQEAGNENLSRTFHYYTDGNTGWLIQAAGPDGDYDWDMTSASIPDATQILIHQYDPTNGTISDGDILRRG